MVSDNIKLVGSYSIRSAEKFINEGKAFLDLTNTKSIKVIEGVGYEKDNNIATLSVRRFLERWRKEFKRSVRHWLITELGQTQLFVLVFDTPQVFALFGKTLTYHQALLLFVLLQLLICHLKQQMDLQNR